MLLWGVYVTPSHRGRGIAGRILAAAIAHARTVDGVSRIQLGVTTPDARRVYERAGFVEWGAEPDSIRHAGQQTTEYHMSLALD